jgi:hypothetical protein
MTRLTTWLTAAVIAALTTAPAAAQQPASTTQAPQPQQEQTQPATSTRSADEHISKAQAALDGIPKDAVTGPAASKIADVRRQLSALEKSSSKAWAANVTAIDKAITSLTADASISADVKAKLEEVRTHLTAFVASKSGTASAEAPAANPASATPPPMTTTPPSQPQPQPPTPQPPTQAQPTPPAQPQPSTPPQPQPSTPPMTPTEQTPPQQPAAPAGQPDQTAARQHLSEARRVLNEVTQLPAAAQLQGEARTQVAQLITNFNALITAQSDWKDKYNAVEQSLNKLIGASAGSAVGTTGSTTTPTPPPTGTAGTTSASAGAAMTVDPAIKTKLEEFRKHLMAFSAAAGGPTVPQL